jgi:hypothetical protein
MAGRVDANLLYDSAGINVMTIKSKGFTVTIPQMGNAYYFAHQPCAQAMIDKPTISFAKKYWLEHYNVRIISPHNSIKGYMNNDYRFVFENEGAYMLFMLEWS